MEETSTSNSGPIGGEFKKTKTREQIVSLEKAYAGGLTSSARKNEKEIEELASNLKLSVQCVKDWINNKRRRKTAPPRKKTPTGRQTAWSRHMSKSLSKADPHMAPQEKFKIASQEYAALSVEARASLKAEAVEISVLSDEDIANMDEAERRAIMKYNRKEISKRLRAVERLGFAGVCLLSNGSSTEAFSNEIGRKFLVDNDLPVVFSESVFRDGKATRSNWTTENVRSLFNRKWVEAGGRGLAPSYTCPWTFEVTGLPEGVPFHRPCDYGKSQVKRIAENARIIQFKMKTGGGVGERANSSSTSASSQNTPDSVTPRQGVIAVHDTRIAQE